MTPLFDKLIQLALILLGFCVTSFVIYFAYLAISVMRKYLAS